MIPLMLLCMIADPWADASPAVEYGPGAGYGQSYYPDNVLGPPDSTATPTFPSFGENNLLTLGTDGWVVLEFTDNSIINGSGADFTVFENVMETGSGYFQECAFVEVSQDGEYWIQFPWNATTLEGLAGVMPTTGEDPTNPAISGGDQFNLDDVGLDLIRFVRLTDCGDAVADGGLFDLDAVAAVNWIEGSTRGSSGYSDVLLVFFDKDGKVISDYIWGTDGPDNAYAIREVPPAGYVVLVNSNSGTGEGYRPFLLRFDLWLSVVWSVEIIDRDALCYSLVQTEDGGFIVAGKISAPEGGTNYSSCVVRLSAEDLLNWD